MRCCTCGPASATTPVRAISSAPPSASSPNTAVTLPSTRDALADLPGIGRSTAAAILAIAHGQREAILDGNVRRVLSRVFGIDGVPTAPATLKVLWAQAEACLPDADAATYTQAIMDFGATLCTRHDPLCMHCPIQPQCVAFATGRVTELPAPRCAPRVGPARW